MLEKFQVVQHSSIFSAMISHLTAAKPQDDELVWLLLGLILSISTDFLGMFQTLCSSYKYFFSSVYITMQLHTLLHIVISEEWTFYVPGLMSSSSH